MARLDYWWYLWCLLVSFGLAVGLIAGLRWLAPRVGMVDRPRARGKRGAAIPLLGGVAVYLAMVVSQLLVAGLHGRALWLMVAAGVMLGLGLVDDRRGLRARLRLGVQLLGAGAIVAAGVHFRWFSWPAANYAVSVVWLVGLMNAINCLDCADGTAGGVAAVATGAFCFIALAQGQSPMALMAVVLLGACTGFLAFNFPPASIFLGDAGSTVLGFLLGALAIESSRGAGPLEQAWIAALPVGVAVWDIVLVHVRRYRGGMRGLRALLESKGDDHLPHRLARAGLRPRQVALTTYLMAGLFAAPAVVLARAQGGGLALAMEIAALGLIAGERPFGELVARVGCLAGGSWKRDQLAAAPSESTEVGVGSRVSAAVE